MIFYLITIFACTAQFTATVYAAPTETSANTESPAKSDVVSRDKITPDVVGDIVKQFEQINADLVTVYRFPPAVAEEMESGLSKLQNAYPADTNVGAYIATLRNILKNRPALKLFNYLEDAGIKQFEQLVRSKPELFAPLFNSLDRIMEDSAKGKEDVTSSFANTPYTEGESPAVTRLRQIVEVNSALASIARITPEAASEIDSVFTKLTKTTYPNSTSFGRALIRLQNLVKNRRVLSWFDFFEKAGAGSLEKLLAAKPHWFQSAQSAKKN